MPEARVEIPKEIWAKANLKANKYSQINKQLIENSNRYLLLLAGFAILGKLFEQVSWTLLHISILFFFYLIDCVWQYFDWRKLLLQRTASFSFYARLDEQGVTITYDDTRISWADYSSIEEHEDYYLVRGKNGLSVLPKNSELQEVIEYTKQRIPSL